jgi:soluble lytic murein transglycosylase-like protein
MMRPAASHKNRISNPSVQARRRRPNTNSENPGNTLPISRSKPMPGRLRLVGEGSDPAHKVWRLTMASTNSAMRLPVLAGTTLRMVSGGFAVIGLLVVLAALLPGPREAALRQLSAWGEDLDGEVVNVSAGTIQAGAEAETPALREQRAVAEFISKRYRVAQDAVTGFVASAYRSGSEWKVDPLLILAVAAVESRYNPVAESQMGAKGLMQIIPKFHADKLQVHGGEAALLDPDVNIRVGAQILREYMRRFGETETALQMYAGAFDEPGSGYAFKVLAERARLEQFLARLRRPSA